MVDAVNMRSLVLLCLASGARGAVTENLVDGACVDGYDESDLFPAKSDSGAYFRTEVGSDYSLLWEVSYHGHYKILRNAHTGGAHVLYQCGVDPPAADDLPEDVVDPTFVRVPVTVAATTSTTYLPFFEMIGERDALAAYTSSMAYVSSACLRKRHRDGDLVEAYDDAAWARDDAALADLGVEVTFADGWSLDAPNAFEMTDVHEVGPDAVLKAAEYVEVVGLFFNREAEASAHARRMVAAYACAKESAAALVDAAARKPRVLWAGYYAGGGGWTPPAAGTWYAELVAAAGGELLVYDGEGDVATSWGSSYLSTAQVAELGAAADVVISPDVWDRDAAPFADLSGLAAVANGRVFDIQGPRGQRDWFERRPVEPDTVLQDLGAVIWPDSAAFGGLERKWLRDVEAGEPVGGVDDAALDAACPDDLAPYASETADLCDDGSGSGGSRAAFVLYVVIAAVVAAALLLAAVACAAARRRRASPEAPAAKAVPTDAA